MATGDTAPPLALSSPQPSLQPNSPSNLSSPLSEPEDKDEYGDESEPDTHDHSNGLNTPTRNKARDELELDAASESDNDSKLSEVDVNDSEAETERLYDTPHKNGVARDIVNTAGDVGQKRFTDRRDRVFERSPSKLHQQLRADIDTEEVDSGRNSGSEDEEDNDDVSIPSSEPEFGLVKEPQLESPLLAKKSQAVSSQDTSQSTRKSSVDSRKRKRSSATEHSESELPLKKRTGSIGAVDREPAEDVAMIDDEGVSTNPQSGSHTADEDNEEPEPTTENKEESDDVLPNRSRKGKRSPTRKRKYKSPGEPGVQDRAPDEPPEVVDMHGLELPTPQPEDDQAEEVDEEAEEAHRNEEELKRKKAAWEELIAIEKQFSSFRERLYQERLEQLNQEEASLMGDNPTHPEYLAMLQCLEERRAEKIRIADVELRLKMSVLEHRAVAERAQIMSQYYQAVRESREEVLAELGQEWYEIQHERRRAANTIPDYGIRFPATKTEAVRNAVSYNKEVSVLSGFAKHVGFPAAPSINGASEEQLDADLEAIYSSREPVPRQVPNQLPAFRPDYSSSLPFGQGLGAAGEQFIEQTPWANPNHPSHQVHRQQAHRDANAPLSYAVPSSVPRRYSSQPGGLFSSSVTTIPNGDSPVQVQKAHPPAVPEKLQGSKMGPEPLKRESAIHAS